MSENIGVLMMIKNEEQSIKTTIDSTKSYFKHIIVLDTGSTDNTIKIVKECCKKNNQILYLKETFFKSFPESRNDALEFAETVKPVTFLVLMDAGDEFQSPKTKSELYTIINSLPSMYNYATVTQRWLYKKDLDDHCDIRFVRNHRKLRYDTKYPVHERFANVANDMVSLNDMIILYQNRNKFAISTNSRYEKDIELFLKAEPNKRNLYFLAQSYMSIDDYYNGYIYNIKSFETKEPNMVDFDEKFTLVRIGFCAMQCKMDADIIFKYLNMAIDCKEPPVDAYVYILKYCIEHNYPKRAVPYLKPLSKLNKPNAASTLINNNFYDYLRWHLISVVSLMTQEELQLGKYACLRAIKFGNRPDDLKNIQFFK